MGEAGERSGRPNVHRNRVPSRPFEEEAMMNDSSDRPLLDLIRRQGPLTVAEMVERPWG